MIVNPSTFAIEAKAASAKTLDKPMPVVRVVGKSMPDEVKAETQESITPLIYPKNLNTTTYIVFNAYNYKNNPDFSTGVKRTFDFKKSIYLPLPSEISDSFGASWEASELGIIGELARSLVKDSIGDLSVNDVVNNTKSSFQTAKRNFSTSLGKLNAAEIGGGMVSSVITAPSDNPIINSLKTNFRVGANPFAVMAYKGIGFKQHQFSWTFYPESKSESETIKKIVNYFRREMLPEKINKYLVAYPAIFEISIKPDKNTMKFKRCVLTDMNINYTPNGPAFIRTEDDVINNKGGNQIDMYPAAVTMSLAFKEIELWMADDFSAKEEDSFDYVSNVTTQVEEQEPA